jgi:hypothetical protein
MRRRSVYLSLVVSSIVLSTLRTASAAPPSPTPTTEAKPDAKPADAKPADAKPADANAKPADAKPADAKADTANLKEAKVHYERGTALYNDFEFKLALIEFKRAYELAPNYRILYNIGQVNLQLNNYADALTSLERYLNEGGKEIPAKRKEQVQKDIVALKARTAHISVTVHGAEGAEVSIDDNALGAAPISKQLVDAGVHRIAISKEGYQPASKSVTLVGGDDTNVELELVPVPVQPAPDTRTVYIQQPDGSVRAVPQLPPPPPPPSYVWLGWVATGVFAAGAVTTGVLSLSAKSDLEDERAGRTSPDALDSARSKAQTLGIVTDVLIGASVVAAGATLYFTLKKSKTPTTGSTDSGTALRVGVGPGALRLGGSF